jgi:hypothetical protein
MIQMKCNCTDGIMKAQKATKLLGALADELFAFHGTCHHANVFWATNTVKNWKKIGSRITTCNEGRGKGSRRFPCRETKNDFSQPGNFQIEFEEGYCDG